MVENAVALIKLKGEAELLTVDMKALNSMCHLFGEMMLSMMPRLVCSRVLEANKDLQVGFH